MSHARSRSPWPRLGLAVLVLACGSRTFAANGVTTDGPVSLHFNGVHWGSSTPSAALLGTAANPATNALSASGWFYRYDGECGEHPFPWPDWQFESAGRLVAWWQNVNGRGFSATETTWVIDDEGPSGAVVSAIDITAGPGVASKHITVFHYLDPKLEGTAANDALIPMTSRYLKFKEGTTVLRYRAESASHFQVVSTSALLTALNDGQCSTLDDTQPTKDDGPGDMRAAFQFDQKVGTQQTTVGRVTLAVDTPRNHVRGDLWGVGAHSDLLFRGTAEGVGHAWKMRRESRYASGDTNSPQPGWEILARNDFNGQSIEKSVTRNTATGELRIGTTLLTGAAPPPLSWILASTADLTSDAKADLVWFDPSTGLVSVWAMSGAQKIAELAPSPAFAPSRTAMLVGTGDFDGDGHPDLLWYEPNELTVAYLDASLTQVGGASIALSPLMSFWRPVAIGDYGKGASGVFDTQDIVWQNVPTGSLMVWHMDHAFNRTSTVTIDGAGETPGVLIGPR